MRDLARHYDGLGPSPLEKTIARNASSGVICDDLLSACADLILCNYNLKKFLGYDQQS